MKNILHLIKNNSWQEILGYAQSLTDTERKSTIGSIQIIDIDKDILKTDPTNLNHEQRADFYDERSKIDYSVKYFLLTCTRNFQDINMLEQQHEFGSYNPFYNLIRSRKFEPIISFYKLFPPDYLDKVVKEISSNRFRSINFRILWKCYENRWVQFDEAFFVTSLMTVPMFDRNTVTDAEFLYENKKALESVFLKFFKHQTPILDISKWEAREGHVCKKVWEFWSEVIVLLQERDYKFDRTIVTNLFRSLLNNWKKPHLDWHVRLLKYFKPSQIELIENQATLFSIFGTGQTSLMNYSMQCIKSIYQHEEFNRNSFEESFAMTFTNEKFSKSILTGLDILAFNFSNFKTNQIIFRENLAMLLMQPNTNVQDKTAKMLVEFFNDKDLIKSIEPYSSHLKQKAKEILSVKDDMVMSISDVHTENEYYPLDIISTWDQLLLHIGKCIRTQSFRDIEVFYKSLAMLQEEIPSDYVKQIKPYTKQLFNRIWENNTMLIFTHFINHWVANSYSEIEYEGQIALPFMVVKSNLLLAKLKKKEVLPFLSTPTHNSCFVHPAILLNKLLQYEEAKHEVNLEDLIVSCNRVIKSEINTDLANKSKNLKGYYAKAIQYLFGTSTTIDYTDITLPLWTQITRNKNPNGHFHEFESSHYADFPSVVKPFEINYLVHVEKNKYATWNRLIFEDNWNYSWLNKEKTKTYEHIFYNTASSGIGARIDIDNQISLNPNYVDSLLCRYVPETASGNEVDGFEKCLYPIRFILENQLTIYHSGWLYIAVCILFEKESLTRSSS